MTLPLPCSALRLGAGLLLAGGLLAARPATAQWTAQNSGLAANSGINNFSIVDANTVWATGFNGASTSAAYTAYTRTTNGGTTWTPGSIAAASGYSLVSVAAVSSTTAWVACDNLTSNGGRVYYTTDGGTTWTQQLTSGFPAASAGFVNGVLAFSATQAVAAGDPLSTTGTFEIYYTANAGTTWTAATTPARLSNIEGGLTTTVVTVPGTSATARACWMGTNAGRVLRSTNSGVSWTAATTGLSAVTSLAFCSATTGMALDGSAPGLIAYTTDGGATWTLRQPSGPLYTSFLSGVPGLANAFVSTGSDNNGTGSSYSVDGGTNWTDFDPGVGHSAVAFLNGTTGWSGGYAASTTSGGMFKGRLPAAVLATTSARLLAGVGVYPNPATDAFTVAVPAAAGAPQVQATLFNALGQLVARQQAALPATGAQLSFPTTGLAQGLYTLRVQAGDALVSKQVSVR